jgi:Transposase DDE domain group 1
MLEQGICRLETIPTSRIDSAVSEALSPWRRPLAVHDPGNIVLDLAIALALGGDCLADVNLLRAEPGVFGRVASDPTVSRLVDTLAADVDRALAATKQAQATARQKVWALAGEYAPDHSTDASAPLIIDLDATLVTAHSEKEHAAPTFKRGFGFHPLLAFVDHGQAGTAEPLHLKLRPGTLDRTPPPTTSPSQGKALAQLPRHRPGSERMPRRRYTHRPPRPPRVVRSGGGAGPPGLARHCTSFFFCPDRGFRDADVQVFHHNCALLLQAEPS